MGTVSGINQYGEDLVACLEEYFGASEHLEILLLVFFGEGCEVFSSEVGDQKGAGDDVADLSAFIPYGAVQIQVF